MHPPQLALILLPLLAGPASAQVSIVDIRAQLFLERSGRLSRNLVGTDAVFFNTIIGGGDAGEPAEALLVTVVFAGPPDSRSSDTDAREFAAVTVRDARENSGKVLASRSFRGLLFGESGRVHKPILLENVTCTRLEIEARSGASVKTAQLDFRCGE